MEWDMSYKSGDQFLANPNNHENLRILHALNATGFGEQPLLGFPNGELGRLLALMQEIDHNGLKPMLDPLRK